MLNAYICVDITRCSELNDSEYLEIFY